MSGGMSELKIRSSTTVPSARCTFTRTDVLFNLSLSPVSITVEKVTSFLYFLPTFTLSNNTFTNNCSFSALLNFLPSILCA